MVIDYKIKTKKWYVKNAHKKDVKYVKMMCVLVVN